MKNIFIAGGSSLLGINSIDYLNSRNFNITASYNQNFVKNLKNVNFIKIDLTNKKSTMKLIEKSKPELIINFAGLTNVEKCQNDPKLAYLLNVEIANNLSFISSKYDIPFVQMSTDHLFNNAKKIFHEKDTPNPLNVYSKTKLEAEKSAIMNNQKTIIVRSNFFCKSTDYKNSFIDFITTSLIKKKAIQLFHDVNFTPILYTLLLDYILLIVKKNKYGIYNISSNESLSKYDFGVFLAKYLKLNTNLIVPVSIYNKDLVIRPLNMSLNNTKLKKTLNIELPSLKEQFDMFFKNKYIGINSLND